MADILFYPTTRVFVLTYIILSFEVYVLDIFIIIILSLMKYSSLKLPYVKVKGSVTVKLPNLENIRRYQNLILIFYDTFEMTLKVEMQ